jgi:hypothetical protein
VAFELRSEFPAAAGDNGGAFYDPTQTDVNIFAEHPIIGLIGQNGRRGSRVRFIDFPTPAGTVRIKMRHEGVTPTGGGYFFAPSISAIRDVLAA